MLNFDSFAATMTSPLTRRYIPFRHRSRRWASILAIAGLLASVDGAEAVEPFSFATSYHDVAKDPDNVWSGKDLSPSPKGVVTIYEYRLTTPRGEYVISQIWNADCAVATCPTRLLEISRGGHRTLLVDDMMRQIIPPDDPRFAGMSVSKDQAAFAQHPFALSDDGKTLLNGDFKFAITGSVR